MFRQDFGAGWQVLGDIILADVLNDVVDRPVGEGQFKLAHGVVVFSSVNIGIWVTWLPGSACEL